MIKFPYFCLLFVFIFAFLLTSCTDVSYEEEIMAPADNQPITFEIGTSDYGNPSSTFDITSSRDDLFSKWQMYNEQEMKQDEWDAAMRTDENEEDYENESVRRGSGSPIRDYQ